jgi:hypothetical protein
MAAGENCKGTCNEGVASGENLLKTLLGMDSKEDRGSDNI